jgi:hypothetical protein
VASLGQRRASYLGDAAAAAISRYGLYAAGGTILLTAAGYLIVRKIERRVVDDDAVGGGRNRPSSPPAEPQGPGRSRGRPRYRADSGGDCLVG